MTVETTTPSGDTPGQGNVSDGTPATTPAPGSNGQNDNSASTPANTQRHDTPGGQGFDLSKLTDRIDALPESIANAVKELIPQTAPAPAHPTSTSDNSSNPGNGSAGTSDAGNGASSVSGNAGTNSHPRHVRFANWWFGK